MSSKREHAKPDYGLDAPGVVRNLLVAGGVGLLVWALCALGVLGPVIHLNLAGVAVNVDYRGMALGCGLSLTATGLWMIWSSKVGKVRDRERLLDYIAWRGTETVLDVGCGRGLMLVACARRLTEGRAVGIDIWQAEDLTDNRPDATLENARLEGVEDRVDVKTADMREIPFGDATFDVVVSCAAIHNLYSADDRARAIGEIARVLRPGGEALIADIRHAREYAAELGKRGFVDIRREGSRVREALWGLVTFGGYRPATLHARKAG